MDRPRAAYASRNRARGGGLSPLARAPLLAMVTAGCTLLTADFDRIVALQIDQEDRTVVVGDTIHLAAQAVDAAGKFVADAEIFWAIIDVDSGQIGFTLDTVTGIVSGVQPGFGRVQARVEKIRSNPIPITVVTPTGASSTSSSARPRSRQASQHDSPARPRRGERRQS